MASASVATSTAASVAGTAEFAAARDVSGAEVRQYLRVFHGPAGQLDVSGTRQTDLIDDEIVAGTGADCARRGDVHTAGETFANLPEGATFAEGGTNFKASYLGGNGNDFTITPVPEPATTMLILLGGAGAAQAWRRRRGRASEAASPAKGVA